MSVIGSGDHHRIIPTGRMVAYYRSFSDVPYARETCEILRAEEAARLILQDDFDIVTRFSGPFTEARYKCFNRFISAYDNVLELAVGTSIERGLAVSDDSGKIYIGTDLPETIEATRALLGKMPCGRRTNHYLEVANVLSLEELNAAANHLGGRQDLLILHEGLWLYLTMEEQMVCAENVRKILERYGGQWVTPDITDLQSTQRLFACLEPELCEALRRVVQRVAALTGRDVEKNCFRDRHEAIGFFRRLGFDVSHYRMVDERTLLASTEKLWGTRESAVYQPLLNRELVWVMSLC